MMEEYGRIQVWDILTGASEGAPANSTTAKVALSTEQPRRSLIVRDSSSEIHPKWDQENKPKEGVEDDDQRETTFSSECGIDDLIAKPSKVDLNLTSPELKPKSQQNEKRRQNCVRLTP